MVLVCHNLLARAGCSPNKKRKRPRAPRVDAFGLVLMVHISGKVRGVLYRGVAGVGCAICWVK